MKIILSYTCEKEWLLLLLLERLWCTVEMVSSSLEVNWSLTVLKDTGPDPKALQNLPAYLPSKDEHSTKKYLQKVLPKPSST